jgi:hypothetical protein
VDGPEPEPPLDAPTEGRTPPRREGLDEPTDPPAGAAEGPEPGGPDPPLTPTEEPVLPRPCPPPRREGLDPPREPEVGGGAAAALAATLADLRLQYNHTMNKPGGPQAL